MAQSPQLQFYLARAAQANADAQNATLDNVRDRCRRSEEAWNLLAERAQRVENMRAPVGSAGAPATTIIEKQSLNEQDDHEEAE